MAAYGISRRSALALVIGGIASGGAGATVKQLPLGQTEEERVPTAYIDGLCVMWHGILVQVTKHPILRVK